MRLVVGREHPPCYRYGYGYVDMAGHIRVYPGYFSVVSKADGYYMDIAGYNGMLGLL